MATHSFPVPSNLPGMWHIVIYSGVYLLILTEDEENLYKNLLPTVIVPVTQIAVYW